MQAGGRGSARPPIGIALEGDLGNRIDVVLAVAMLNGLTAKGEARSIALGLSAPSLEAAQLADVVSDFYTPRPLGGAAMLGMPAEGRSTGGGPALAAVLSRKAADGTPEYTSNITSEIDTADDAVLIRNMLLAQNDGNASIVLAGRATGLARLLALYGAPPQISAKVSHLVLAIGAFPTGPADSAIKSDVAAMRKVLAEWPTPVVAVGSEVGAALPYPGSSIETDFSWSPAHPVADAYRAFKPMPYDAPAPALAAMLYAVHPDRGDFTVSEPGTISVLDDGRTQFTPGPTGTHRYLMVDPAQKDRIIKLYVDLVSARPAVRPGRGRRGAPPAQPQQQQQPVPPRRPAEPK
jgi:hypothetical protein